MKITHVADQGSVKLNEDTLLIQPPIFGVFDGATSLDKYQDDDGHTGGWIVAHLLLEAFENAKGSLLDTLRQANNDLRDKIIAAGRDFDDSGLRWRAAGAVIKIDENEIEWVQINDCVILFVRSDGSIQVVGGPSPHEEPLLLQWQKLSQEGLGWQEIRKQLREKMLSHRAEANKLYGVIDGDPAFESFIETGEIKRDGITDILIFTDGFELPKKDPKSPADYQPMIDLYKKGGLDLILKTIRDAESSDPQCHQYPRFKPHDDIAAIAVRL
ncbi:MAG: protein phosphatase 2C domain-containing protein [Patescibacteria group bacterium]